MARLDAASEISRARRSELWVDVTKLHLFDPDDGRSLTSSTEGPPATEGDQGTSGREPDAGHDGGAQPGAAAGRTEPAG